MSGGNLRLGPISRQRVGVITQTRNRHAVGRHEVLNLLDRGRRDVSHIDVRCARVTPLGLARRPAHHFNAREARLVGEAQDLFERVFRHDGRHESKFHGHAFHES